ncbi:ICOS ligand-like [Thalassophryne amazonica]|uniref:ICOS ligand-like n=1 Tax=Thalassophryne amazonica TaxID=390379 RepID=UPI001471BD96|nr:ICOS ligand-like [Thalassophryne amazonica]XP_034036494.1 ICOS ligand-like [Thalassophryne amazonica]XP_034036495.1 ICOS ligand-like [Thalassophryne amazonica]
MCPQWAMLLALWHPGLLLTFLGFSACVEEQCVLGIVGQPVSLPCFYREQGVASVNVTVEWRRDNEVLLRSVWAEDGTVETWSTNSSKISANAPQTGNFSLELPAVVPEQPKMYYSLFVISQENHSVPMCTVCLRTAASFSFPLLQKEEKTQGDEMVFLCHSSGGYPEPVVSWLINDVEEPPNSSVRTTTVPLPGSHLYNITSQLRVNISQDFTVSCIIKNQPMNQTLMSKSSGVQDSVVVTRVSQAMWIFSTALCVVVGILVVIGVAYQIHLDRNQKKRYQQPQPARGYKRRRPYDEETTGMTLEAHECLTETDV